MVRHEADITKTFLFRWAVNQRQVLRVGDELNLADPYPPSPRSIAQTSKVELDASFHYYAVGYASTTIKVLEPGDYYLYSSSHGVQSSGSTVK